MVEVSFQRRFPYTISPHRWTYPKALGTMLAWHNLDDVARFAVERRGYGNTDSGVGLDYPKKEDRAGQVRIWYWDWSHPKLKTRSFHIPEVDYLATLAGLLRLRGHVEQAEAIEALQPLPTVTVTNIPDPFYIGNYVLEPFTYDAYHALRLTLELRDFDRASELFQARETVTLPDGSGLSFPDDGTVFLTLVRGRTTQVSVELYETILAQARKETGL